MELDPKWFRRKVAMVGQEPVLFGCTIGENIAYGKNASQEEVLAVRSGLELANAISQSDVVDRGGC